MSNKNDKLKELEHVVEAANGWGVDAEMATRILKAKGVSYTIEELDEIIDKLDNEVRFHIFRLEYGEAYEREERSRAIGYPCVNCGEFMIDCKCAER